MKKAKKTETLAERVTRLRESKELTRIDLAVAAGVSQGAIQLIEKGATRKPSAAMISKLAGALGVSNGLLLEGIDEPTPARR
jgi:transcriptional regulator with XRE-family HTH domain